MKRRDNIKNIIEKFVKEEEFSGAILIKEEQDMLYRDAHGHAHRGFKVKNKIDTKFDCGGVTKLFTTVAILQLVERGLLSLDDKVMNILDIKESKINRNITIFHLLTHSSGMGDDYEWGSGKEYSDLFIHRPNYSIEKLEDALPLFINKEQVFEPGEGTNYNNGAFILLGLVIEKITGEKYQEFVKNNVFSKADMSNTGFFNMSDIVENRAECYEDIIDDNNNLIGFKKNIYSYPSCGLSDRGALTTVDDMLKFYDALWSGKLLGEEMTKEMTNYKVFSNENNDIKTYYGFGIDYMVSKEEGKVYMATKTGFNYGVVACTAFIPEYDVKIMILGNQYANIYTLAYNILREYYQLGERC
ncbi:serine hydrolase domain-containing protein [Oceanirhabdus sp. W0125-5]|uniref:serine hydrolase domain-containing protein n=1 Tax=Oceanirhabdus sp. W0125-5 TaxID=2999116 RepID=UPI0022F2ABD3|nr:serine hydrolase domain-containing protein [Oceanirhabdus sp. W0125-5]WBW99230.1 serine hydrolase [Oceanirhabdus sp. W0125-5]